MHRRINIEDILDMLSRVDFSFFTPRCCLQLYPNMDLPKGWDELRDDKNQRYYYNEGTGESVWTIGQSDTAADMCILLFFSLHSFFARGCSSSKSFFFNKHTTTTLALLPHACLPLIPSSTNALLRAPLLPCFCSSRNPQNKAKAHSTATATS